MIKRDELIRYIYSEIGEEFLAKALTKDEVANGVQVLGGEAVEKVSLGVTLNQEFLEKASRWGSNFSIFHHGLDPRTYKSRIGLSLQKRLKLIFEKEMTILGFHYALDAHPKIGNNAIIIKKLGARIVDTLFEEWGYVAEFDKPKNIEELAHECEHLFNHDIFVVDADKKKVKRIGVVSGAAKPYAENVAEMEQKAVELFISGETSESTPHRMQESGIAYFVCGHYATEKFGVLELGNLIKKRFGNKLTVEFIDIPNPI
ncbi:Nif3-like dinuclear metal center hexameric protein [Candidatus Woesebacteria bacterium]|nr:Nif3-like dinuclear metal center hexameric protein [Candidatus Woesebacteria bacterium]